MRNFNTTGGVKALLMAGCASTVILAAPAMAQDSAADTSVSDAAPIIVTGSRIVRRDFQANSPIVTVDESLLTQSSTSAIESNLNKLPQFTPAKTPTQGGDIQPTATNTPGAATVSLRGIGANRNLVLVDGRRATPGNATGVVDITTIPSAAIERVEIISGGASATYGADAVAGVTNFILKKNFQGLELDGQLGITEQGDGFEYQFSGIMGSDFDDGRGNISVAMSMNTREASFQRDRKIYRDLWADPSVGGSGFFPQAPGYVVEFGVPVDQAVLDNIFGAGSNLPREGFNLYTNPDGTLFTTAFNARGGVDRFQNPGGLDYKVTDAGTIAPNFTDSYLVLPLTRYNFFARGNYEINDSIGVFVQGQFSKVSTETIQEPGPITGGWGVLIDPANLDADQLSSEMWQVLNSRTRAARPGEPGYITPTPGAEPPVQPIVSAAADPFQITSLMPDPRETFTDVTTYTLIAGIEGKLPFRDWTYEAFVNHGESETYALQTGIYSLSRLRTVLQAPNFGRGFTAQGNPGAPGFGFASSSASCTSGLNFFMRPEGGFSQDCMDAIKSDLKNRSNVRQTIVETNLQGGLFELPAGEVRAAIGASYRELDYEFINDTLTTQGTSFNDQALGIYPSGNSNGFIETKEIYGELLIPILSDIPAIQRLELEIGGRISDYNTTGTSYTYKVLGDWQVTDWLRFRGGYNRAERAPNIAELYLAPQQTFGSNSAGDVCSLRNPTSFSANPDTNANAANVEATCRILMRQSGDSTADQQYYSNPQSADTGGFSFPTLVGNSSLKPETADTWTAGTVINSPFTAPALSRLQLSVDYYNIRVKDAIGAQTVGIAMQQCFDPALNPLIATDPVAAANTQFCQNVPRNAVGTLGNVQTTFVNNGRFKVSGIDVALNWGVDVGPGSINLNSNFSYLIDFKSSALPTLPMVDYAGTFGTDQNGLNLGAFEYRILTTLGYNVGPATIALQWQHLPSVEDGAEALLGSTPTTGAPSYNLFNLNGSFMLTDAMNLRFGVDNLFNKRPPLTGINLAADPSVGNLPGGSYNSNFYDTIGRRFYLGANVKF